jgi:hypothetical protein
LAHSKGPNPSEGAAGETRDAHSTGKDVFRIWPKNIDGKIYCSPFVWSRSTGVYGTIEELLSEMDKIHGGPKDIVIPPMIIEDAFKVSLTNRGVVPPGYH